MQPSYTGPGVEATVALCQAAHGGQVVLSEQAWAIVQDQLPGTAQVGTWGSRVHGSHLSKCSAACAWR